MPKHRVAEIVRSTRETEITLFLDLDGTGQSEIHSGIGFFDHMLEHLVRHSGMDLKLKVQGDLQVDAHHSVEDVGICLGLALERALNDKRGIGRYGWAYAPMDETLVRAVMDLSGRAFLAYDVPLRTERVGEFPAEMMEEFWRAFAMNAKCTLHLTCLYGNNQHHIFEAAFKAVAQGWKQAVRCSPDSLEIPSTKGTLG